MRKLLVIAAQQETLGTAPGPHTLTRENEQALHAAAGSELTVVIETPEGAPAHFADSEIIVAFPMRMPSIDQVPRAKWLHLFSAGVDAVLTPKIRASEILVSNSSGIHATPIAEHIIGFILMFTRDFNHTFRNQQAHAYTKSSGLSEIRDAEILIVGLGEIGKETARLCKAFGARVSAVSRSGKNKPEFVDELETSDKLDTLLPTADFVVITLPGTPETKNLFDRKKMQLMSAQGRSASGGKKSAVLINIGRGGIVNEIDLAESLRAGEIAGAALDVFETEPLPKESPLWDFENIVITPHQSGLSHQYMNRATALLIKNLDAYLKGEPLPNLVDKTLGY